MEEKKKEPIRVLHVLQRMEAAGVQTLLMNLYRSIDRSKVQFDFLVHYTERQFFDDEIESMGGRVYRLSVREDYNFFKYCKDLDVFFNQHNEYKILHGHMHSLGAIYLHYAKKHGVPVRIAHSHTNATQNDAKKLIKQFMNKLYKRDATHLFACSKEAGRYMFGGDEFTVINNAIDSNKYVFSENKRKEKRRELDADNKIVIGNVGRFEIQKNQKFTVKLFREFHLKHPGSILWLVGSGTMEDEIRILVNSLGLEESVRFLGNRKDVAELYMAMDAFLFPSLFEGLGIVGIEAQAAGTPVICTDTLPEEINVTNLIKRVPLDAGIDIWVAALEKAIDDLNAHRNMRKDIICADYDINVLAKKLEDFYMNRSKVEE